MYRLDVKYTGEYGEINPDTGKPEITITPDSKPGTYIYSWHNHYATVNPDEINGSLSEELSGIAYYSFNVYYGSDSFDSFFPNRTAVQLWSNRHNKYIFSGRVVSADKHLDSNGAIYKSIVCESEIAYLCDSICDINDVLQRIEEKGRSLNSSDVIITMLELHHMNSGGIAGYITKGFFPPYSRWDEDKQEFIVNSGKTPYKKQDMKYSFDGDINTTYILFKQFFVENLGWDIWITHDESIVDPEKGDANWQFGYLVFNAAEPEFPKDTSKISTIELGKNIKNITIESTPTSDGRITRIVPLGGVGANGKRLTVESIQQFHEGWTDPDHSRAVANEFLQITYGLVDKVIIYDDLTDDGNKTPEEVEAMIQELYNRGKREADALSDNVTGIKLNGVDLFEAGYDVEAFSVGNYYLIKIPPLGLSGIFRLIKKVTDLADPCNPQLTFDRSSGSVSSQTVRKNTSTANRIYNTEKTIANRMDNTAIKDTNAADYESLKTKYNKTIYLADQGDGTVKAYLGDKPIVISGGGSGGTIEHAAVLTSDAAELLTEHELVPLDMGMKSQVYYGSPKNKFLINNGLTVIFAKDAAELRSLVKEEDLSALNIGIQNSSGAVNYYDLIPYSVGLSGSSVNTNFRIYMPDLSGYRMFTASALATDSGASPAFVKTAGLVFWANNIYSATGTYPYGYINGYLALVFFDRNNNVFSNTSLATASGTFTALSNTSQRFLSQAEYDFAMSIITRSELVKDGENSAR